MKLQINNISRNSFNLLIWQC